MPPIAPQHWPTWLLVALLKLFSMLPAKIGRGLGASLGTLLRVVWPSRYKIVQRNLSLCFPDLSAQQQQARGRQHMRSLGMSLYETACAFFWRKNKLLAHGQVENIDLLERASADGKGILVLGSHFTHMEFDIALFGYSFPSDGIYRPHKNKVLEWIVRRSRLRYCQHLISRDDIRGMLRALRKGRSVWYAPDQDYRRGKNVFAPFFGVPASTTTATARLVQATGCAVFAMHTWRDESGLYNVVFEKVAIDWSDDPVQSATRINQVIEKMVARAPEQYLWVHRRFKARPEGEESVYD